LPGRLRGRQRRPLHRVSEGEALPIVFVHGLPEVWYEWRAQLTEFASDHRAIVIHEQPAAVNRLIREFLAPR